jgi:hypothetical protein
LSALGNLLVVSDSVPYAYTVEADNNNGRTLQGFSESANTKMRPGGSTQEPYIASFQMFFDYYGSFDYADQIISAGFENGNTNLANGNVNLQSSGVGFDAREGKEWVTVRFEMNISCETTNSRVRSLLQRLFRKERPTFRWLCMSSGN